MSGFGKGGCNEGGRDRAENRRKQLNRKGMFVPFIKEQREVNNFLFSWFFERDRLRTRERLDGNHK